MMMEASVIGYGLIKRVSQIKGTWAFPGGHVEPEEHPEMTAIRETREETALDVKMTDIICGTRDDFSPEKQYLTLFVKCALSDTNQKPVVSFLALSPTLALSLEMAGF